jgi:hypothetical protein
MVQIDRWPLHSPAAPDSPSQFYLTKNVEKVVCEEDNSRTNP